MADNLHFALMSCVLAFGVWLGFLFGSFSTLLHHEILKTGDKRVLPDTRRERFTVQFWMNLPC